MRNNFILVTVIVFFVSFFVYSHKVNASVCSLSAIQNEYAARGLSGSGMEQEAIDNCLNQQRIQDQQARDQAAADTANAQALYQIKLDYFYKEDAIEKQLNALNSSDSNYFQYRLRSTDCLESIGIPSDPTILNPNEFLAHVGSKEKCINYLLQYKAPTPTPTLLPTKSNDQVCIDTFGQNWKWDGTKNNTGNVNCGCKDGYTYNNRQCVTYDQSCNISYPNTIFLKIDDTDGRRICDCKTGYVWNEQRTGCIIAPIIPTKTNDQVCQDSYGSNSNWNGTKNDKGGLTCDCKIGYTWNYSRTECILISPTPTPTSMLTPIPASTVEPTPAIESTSTLKPVVVIKKQTPKPTIKPTPTPTPEIKAAEIVASIETPKPTETPRVQEYPKPRESPKQQEAVQQPKIDLAAKIGNFLRGIKLRIFNFFK